MWLRNFLYEGEGGEGVSNGGGTPPPAAPATIIAAAAPAAGSSQQPAAAAPWAKDDGSFSEGWASRLPDGLKDHASLKTIQSLPDLAKAFVETKGLVGKKLEMPGDGATPEQVAGWRKVTGAPETAAGYRGDAVNLKPESLPDEAWSVETEGKFLEIAHKHHMPPAAVKEILSFYGTSLIDSLKGSQADEAAMVASETTKLRTTWGQEFDANLSNASRMAKTVGLDPATDPIFTNARAVEAFSKMAKLISSDKLVSGENPSLNGAAKDRVKDITDPKSTSVIAREYRGEFGPERQGDAQKQLHQLMAT